MQCVAGHIPLFLCEELHPLIANGEKEEYTKDEIVELLDKIAMAKKQE